MKDIIFVYGTLMKGHCNDHYLRELKYLGIGRLNNYEMYHVSTYPGIVKNKGGYIIGELYEIDEKTLKRLDILENEGDLFLRKKLDVILDTEEIKAHVYVWNKAVEDRTEKVTQIPWQPLKKNVSTQLRVLNKEKPLEEGTWPLIVKTKTGDYYEACTVRGVVAGIIGENYISNEKSEDDWQSRIKYSVDKVMSNETKLHVVIKDKHKGVIAENFILESDSEKGEDTIYNVYVESERAFIYSLAQLGCIEVFERENESYLKNWRDDGNDVTIKTEVANGKYINITEYNIDSLLEKTWT